MAKITGKRSNPVKNYKFCAKTRQNCFTKWPYLGRQPYYTVGALGHLGHCFGALGALVWGTWGTRLGHLGHSSGALEEIF